MVQELLDDPRHTTYLNLLREARMAFRLQLRQLMDRKIEAPDAVSMAWISSRIEFVTDLLDAPEQIATALADQRLAAENGQAALSESV